MENNFLDYDQIIKTCYIDVKNFDDDNDIAIVIPIMNRENQVNVLIDNLNESINYYNKKKYRIIFIEHDIEPKNKDSVMSKKCDYIFIPKKNGDERFNKCLCMNLGALLVKSKYYIFHDVDLVVKKDFFKNIFINLKRIGDDSVIHCFTNRRVIYLNKDISEMVRNKTLDIHTINEINEYNPYSPYPIMYGGVGAPGGSIFINSELFFKVGGYDDNIFNGYSPEDDFFWKKIEIFKKINSCDDPINEVFHLFHNSLQYTKLEIHEKIKNKFASSDLEKKLKYIELKSKYFKYEKRK
jgi:hypothetical protein